MALIKCPECGKEISDKAGSCPNCGMPLSNTESNSPHVSTEKSNEESKPSNEKKALNKKHIIVISVVLAVLAIAAAVLIPILISNSLSPEEVEAVNTVSEAISAIGEVNTESKDKIEYAESLYDALTPKEKKKVSNYKDLVDARESYDHLLADAVIKKIDSIGTVNLSSGSKIDECQNEYDKLTPSQQALVTNIGKIAEARTQLSDLLVSSIEELISSLGTISLDSATKGKITQARDKYENLSNEEKARVSNIGVLEEAESKYNDLMVADCVSKIDSIGTVSLSKESEIKAARDAYSSLPSGLKSRVSNLSVLESAERELSRLKAEEEERKKMFKKGDTITGNGWELYLRNVKITDKILPDDTSGYYYYYYADDGCVFIDIIIKAKNTSSSIKRIQDIVGSSKVTIGSTVYNISPELYYNDGSSVRRVYSSDGIDAMRTEVLHIAFTISTESQNASSIKIEITLAGQEKIIKVK